MVLYENTIENFIKASDSHILVKFMLNEYETKSGLRMHALAKANIKYIMSDLENHLAALDINNNCGIRIEFHENSISTSLMVILASSVDGCDRAVWINFIPWEKVRLSEDEHIVWCDYGFGDGEQEVIHPSYQSSAFMYRYGTLCEKHQLEAKSYVYLMDITWLPSTDIVTDYDKKITDMTPVIYADQVDQLTQIMQEAVSGDNGIKVLRKLHTIENDISLDEDISLMDDQILIKISVMKHLRTQSPAWYFILNPSGTGGTTLIDSIRREADETGHDVVVVEKGEYPDPETFPKDQVLIWLFDEFMDPELIKEAEEIAAKNEVEIHKYKLNQVIGYSDDGSGVNWIARYLQLGDIIKKEWNPETFSIKIVDSPDDLPSMDGYVSLVIRNNITYDPQTKKVNGEPAALKSVYRKLSKGRKGVFIYAEDPELQKYLKKSVEDATNKYSWITEYKKTDDTDGEGLRDAQKSVLKIDTVQDKYRNMAIGYMGQGAWDKMSEESQKWIVSGFLAFHDMKKFDQLMDFSGVCVTICKAVETEIGERFFYRYKSFLEKKYGDEVFEKAPYGMLEKGSNKKEFLHDPTIGSYPHITGMGYDGKINKDYAWREFEDYCNQELLLEGSDPKTVIHEHLTYTNKIRKDYRNTSAHKQTVDVVMAQDCIDYVVGILHRLGIMLDAYRF